MNAPLIKAASTKDVSILAHLHTACFNPAWDEAAMQSLFDNGAKAWLGYADDKVCGLAIIRMAVDEAELLSLAVLPDIRQQGLGRILLNSVLEAAQKNGASTIFLEVAHSNTPACRLYGTAGFERVGIRARYYANGDDALVFKRALV